MGEESSSRLGASTSVMKDKLGKAGGDALLSKTVEKIKVERAATSKRRAEGLTRRLVRVPVSARSPLSFMSMP